MLFRFRLRIAALVALVVVVFSVCALSAQDKRGRKYKAPPPMARIEVTVLKDGSGKPIENASVIFHGLNDPDNMELKTNEDGKTVIDVLPVGEAIRLQIIARGFQTYGYDYKIEKDQMAIEVRMKRPGEQYSIYKKHDGDAKANPPADEPKK